MANHDTIISPAPTPLDPIAILARAEQVVDVLRTRYVCDGWHGKGLDEVAAERALQYFRRQADGAPEDDQDPEWEAAVAFVGDHGSRLTGFCSAILVA
jgi:predicted GNAT family acetyltransferase